MSEKKRLRISSTYQENHFTKLDKVAGALGIAPTTLQTELVLEGLNNPIVMDRIIEKYQRKSRFHIITHYQNGELTFTVADKLRISKAGRS